MNEIYRPIPQRSPITTHVLDTCIGRPAANVGVTLEVAASNGWTVLAERVTNTDGRVDDLLPGGSSIAAGNYRLTFGVDRYFAGRGLKSFYPTVVINFVVASAAEHYHVPLLLNPFGYSTYRGS